MKNLILGSTSKYRAQLLEKLGIPFSQIKPTFDEDSAKATLLEEHVTPLMLAESLSKGKAYSIPRKHETVIAGDQLVSFNNEILGKSHNFAKAKEQIMKMRGRTHDLITAVTILQGTQEWHINHVTTLKMKNLSEQEVENYLKKEAPYDCAGSYKIESFGITLFDEIQTDDFTAIQGLPLLWISKVLKEIGYDFFQN